MVRRREELSEGKKQIIAGLLDEYDIQSAEDIQNALADLLGPVIQSMLESEMSEHLGYEPYERSDEANSRNGNSFQYTTAIRAELGAKPNIKNLSSLFANNTPL